MRTIAVEKIRDTVANLCHRANFELPAEVKAALSKGAEQENPGLAKNTLFRLLQNAQIAETNRLPLCQDTGLVVVFVSVGQDLQIVGGTLREAINEGVRQGYRQGYLRASVTADPIIRKNTGDNTPAVIYTELVPGEQLRLQLLAKGGGCENMSRFKMLTPAEGLAGAVQFVVETARVAGPNACPPMIIGVGMGGSFDYSAVLAKKALLRRLGERSPHSHVAELEQRILKEINASGIGPQGYGGKTTSIGVHIEIGACHIASLPVSVNVECHAHRHQEAVL